MPKLPLRKSLRADSDLARIADPSYGWRLITYRPSTGFARVALASVSAGFATAG